MIVWPSKDPQEVADYSWQPELDAGDTIAAFTVTLTSGTVSIDDHSFTNTLATVWLSGGVDGETATLTLTIATSGGRTFEEIAVLQVVENSSAASELVAAFPRFAAVPAGTIQFWLTRAARSVDESWTDDDRSMGQMLLAAHLMTLQGLGTGAEAEAAASGTSEFKTIRSGSLTLERFDKPASTSSASFDSTTYGKQFAALARLNVGGPRVMAAGSLPASPYRYPHGQD